MSLSRSAPWLIVFASLGASAADQVSAAAVSFEREVAPILERRCLECHGATSDDKPPKGGLSLTTRAATLKGGESGPALGSPRLDLPFPVRLLHGTADRDVDIAVPLRLLAHATGPDIRLTLVKDADHRFSAPENLELLAETIEAIL